MAVAETVALTLAIDIAMDMAMATAKWWSWSFNGCDSIPNL